MATYEELRERHVAHAAALLPGLMERLDWSAERLAAHRQSELRRLVRVAKDLSPWYRRRLTGIDPDEVNESNLNQLPVMTKDDLMANFDEIVTDDRLRLDVVEDHLESLTGDAYLFDRYHACASGGSTGRRGVFVHDWDSWAIFYWGALRYEIRELRRQAGQPVVEARAGLVAADHATHASSALAQTFANSELELHRFPVTLPIDEIVDGLNACQPALFGGYPSVLFALANEAQQGRLRIAPARITCFAEPLFPEIRAALEETWNVPVINLYGATEFGGTASCGLGPWLHLCDDLTIIEPVDAAGRPVAPGVCSDKIYVTNLFNYTMPLIRYEVTDQLRFLDGPCPCGSVHQRIADPLGRLDDCFHYGDLMVNAHVFRSALGRQRHVVEYQVHQTPGGADVAARCIGPVDFEALSAEIAGELAALGLEAPEVTVTAVDHLERIASSGKLKRFIPLAPLAAAV
jgi:phenylacetate-coenzyme A ligase PaaK-like adenylate-forming protein